MHKHIPGYLCRTSIKLLIQWSLDWASLLVKTFDANIDITGNFPQITKNSILSAEILGCCLKTFVNGNISLSPFPLINFKLWKKKPEICFSITIFEYQALTWKVQSIDLKVFRNAQNYFISNCLTVWSLGS